MSCALYLPIYKGCGMAWLLRISAFFFLCACGGGQKHQGNPDPKNTDDASEVLLPNGIPNDNQARSSHEVLERLLPRVGEVARDGSMIKSRAAINLVMGGSFFAFAGSNVQIPVSVVNVASTTVTFDNSKFVIPPITSDLLSFGSISLSGLSDNNLATCGSLGKTVCTSAVIRLYTVGTSGAGMWNATDGYGAPINAGLAAPYLPVGLTVANALTVQSIKIPASKHALKYTDFPSPTYTIQGDLSNAGAGSYATTLVIEYALLL